MYKQLFSFIIAIKFQNCKNVTLYISCNSTAMEPQTAFFSKPYMAAGEEVSVDMITFFLLRDLPSASYKRRLRLDERNGNNRRASRHTNQNSMGEVTS